MEAILGAIYLDTSSDMAKCKDVVDALELIPQEEKLQREFEIEGLVILDDGGIPPAPERNVRAQLPVRRCYGQSAMH